MGAINLARAVGVVNAARTMGAINLARTAFVGIVKVSPICRGHVYDARYEDTRRTCMKRWLLFVLIGVVLIGAALFTLHQYMGILPPPQSGLARTPNSAFKYNLCTEAYAFAHASPDNPYKTDYTFRDPFRADNDTIVPHLLDYNAANANCQLQC